MQRNLRLKQKPFLISDFENSPEVAQEGNVTVGWPDAFGT
jgi:hypothetical protein